MVSAFCRQAFFLPLVSGVAHRSGPRQVDVHSFHTQPETFELIWQLLWSLIRAHGPLKSKTQACYIPRWSCSIFDHPLLLGKFSVLYRRNFFSLRNYLTDFTRKWSPFSEDWQKRKWTLSLSTRKLKRKQNNKQTKKYSAVEMPRAIQAFFARYSERQGSRGVKTERINGDQKLFFCLRAK